MAFYDVFNGDADGICALQQLRLREPREAELISGLKRDIDLLSRIDAQPGDKITVLDISLDKNREALIKTLDAGASVFYADHHFAGEIPDSQLLECHIDVAATTCTSLIVNNCLGGAQPGWAVVGAFGDNFDQPAFELGRSLGYSYTELNELQQLGICLNYNGYGFELDDLLFHPVDLYRCVHPYADPLEFIESEKDYKALLAQYHDDLIRAADAIPEQQNETAAVFLLPDQTWAKRIVGVMGNDLAKRYPDRAHALLVKMGDGRHRVSVRAPYNDRQGADDICRQFISGGGRKAAAGINALEQAQLDNFVKCFSEYYGEAL
ncbi:MAG: DHH family phosphoesterase [Pseudomonadota bacterium]